MTNRLDACLQIIYRDEWYKNKDKMHYFYIGNYYFISKI
jgi:hypothetical protein